MDGLVGEVDQGVQLPQLAALGLPGAAHPCRGEAETRHGDEIGVVHLLETALEVLERLHPDATSPGRARAPRSGGPPWGTTGASFWSRPAGE